MLDGEGALRNQALKFLAADTRVPSAGTEPRSRSGVTDRMRPVYPLVTPAFGQDISVASARWERVGGFQQISER